MDSITIARYLSAPIPFILAGYGLSASQSTVPLLYKVPSSISAEVFSGVFHNGAKVVAPGAIISAAACAYLAYHLPAQRPLYIGAAALTLSTQPWTIAVMLGGINRLIEISQSAAAEQQKADASGEAVALMKSWVWQNWVRAAMFGSSGLLSLYAWVGTA